MQIIKSENGFDAQIDFKPFKGFSTSRFNNLNLEPPITIHQGSDIYYLPQHSLLLNSFSLTNDDLIRLTGGITQITSSSDCSGFEDAFLRIVIPVANGRPKIRDIRGLWYDCDIKTNDSSLIKVFIHEKEYHFIIVRNSDRNFLIIDSTHKTGFEDFKKVVSNITTAFGFLFGDLFMDEGYFVSSSDSKFSVIDHIFFSTYRDSILSGYSIYTTNPYSVYNVTGQTREEIDTQIEEIKKWYSKILEFDDALFSKLCETFYDKEPFSRAAIIVLQGNQLALEIKGSAYSIALEAITEQVLKDKAIKFPKPIEDSGVFDKLRKELLKIVNVSLPKTNKTLIDANNIFTNRINDLNRPSNADKLKKPFELLGYTLSNYESEDLLYKI